MTRKRILSLYLGFVALLLVGTYVVLRETGVSRTFVENLLSQFLDRDLFQLRGAAIDLGGGTVTLSGLEIAISTESEGQVRLAAEEVVVGIDTNPLGDIGRVRSVRISGMRLEIDLAEGRFPDLGHLLQPATGDDEPSPPPPVEIVESSLRLTVTPDAPPIEFDQVRLQLLPEEPGSFCLALSGSMRSPNGHEVVVEGRGDLDRSEFRVQLRIRDVPFQPQIARPYSARAVDFLAGIGIGGIARSIVVWVEYPDSRAEAGARDEAVLGVRLDLADVRCNVPELPYPIVGASARISADLRDGGTLTFVIEDESVDGNVHVQGKVSSALTDQLRAEVDIDARDVLIGPVLGRALGSIAAARSVWDAFEPTGGRGHARIRFASETRDAPERLSLDLEFDGVSARFAGFEAPNGTREFGFPIPMHDIRGTVRIDEGEVTIDDVRARLGEHDLQVDGHVLLTPGGEPRIELELQSPELGFSAEIRDALTVLGADFAAIYDDYAPEGSTALQVSVRSGPDVATPGVRVRLRPLGASAAWAGFPCRVDQITGLVDIGTDGVVLALEGARGRTSIALEGRFLSEDAGSREAAGPAAMLRITAEELSVDDALGRAMHTLSPSLGHTIDFLGVSGVVDLDLNTWRDAGAEEFGYDVRIDLSDGVVQLENLPLPTHDLSGSIFVHGEGGASRVEIGAVQGIVENGPGRPPADLLVQGTVNATADDYASDLTAVVRGLELNDRLGAAVHAFDALDIRTWNMLEPAGDVDVVWHQTKTVGDPEIHQSLRIQLMGVRSGAAFLPAAAEDIFGDVRVDDGIATFRDVRAHMAGAEVQCTRGSARQADGETVFEAVVTSEEFPVDDRLANLLDGPLKTAYLDRQVRGRVRVHELAMLLRFPASGEGFRSELSGRITALGLEMVLGTVIREITGAWTIDEAIVDSEGGAVRGRVAGGGVSLFAHRASDISASFRADPDEVRFFKLRGRLHGGEISGVSSGEDDVVYKVADPGVLRAHIAWNGLSLTELASASGVEHQRFRGSLSGVLKLDELVGADIVNCTGSGRLQISQGDLGQVPAFTAIYSYLEKPRRPRFEELAMGFRISDRVIRVDDFEVSSPLLTASGDGWIDMGGYLDMRIDFPDFFGTDADWLLLPQAVRMLTSKLAQFQIYGYLRSPKTRPLWLWRDAAPRVPLGPIPASR